MARKEFTVKTKRAVFDRCGGKYNVEFGNNVIFLNCLSKDELAHAAIFVATAVSEVSSLALQKY